MPVNAPIEYKKAELEYKYATTLKERLNALKKMLKLVPKHKGSEKLVAYIKKRIAKVQELIERQKKVAKRTGRSKQGIRKEGACRVCIVGLTNTGKSSLLAKLTNAKPKISPHPFTTTQPEIGTLDYKGIKIQILEMPAIIENYLETKNGNYFASLMREASLIIITFNNEEEKELVEKELHKMNLNMKVLKVNTFKISDIGELKEKIWQELGLIKVYTKQPHKEKDFPPIALNKGSTIEDLAKKIHKDFVKKFRFAKVYGKSVKFNGQQVGLQHVLEDEDVVEIHTKE